MGISDHVRGVDGDPTDQISKGIFEPRLKKLGLTRQQLETQSLAELQTSLTTINHAIDHPESFGVVNVEMTAKAGGIVGLVSTQRNAHIQVGILPMLLELKAFILERINTLRPTEQVRDFRQEVINTVTDTEMRDHLLKVLDERATREQALSSKIEKEAEENAELIKEMAHLKELFSVNKLESRLNSLEEITKRIDSEKTSKFEAVTITTTILATLGGLAGIILAVIRWTTG
jgi:hypothetical protein